MSAIAQRAILPVNTRFMMRRDMAAVLDIESAAFRDPWTKADFDLALRNRDITSVVAERGEQIVAFMVYQLSKTEIDLWNIAVQYEYWGLGIGRQMLEKLAARLCGFRRTHIRTIVQETNLDAQLFFKHCGFVYTQTLHDHYETSDDDAYLMEWQVST